MGTNKLIVLTGAGISAESGLKTFRDSDGLWEGYNVEDVATPEAFEQNPAMVLEFYNQRRRNVAEAKPNEAHLILSALQAFFEVYIITQNIDDLHERAGSKSVLHLHGEIFKMRSTRDPRRTYDVRGNIQLGDMAPDGAQLRPHIVWFGEAVPMIEPAAKLASTANLFAVVGTSLAVYPAAGLIHYVPETAPIFVVDKKIPTIARHTTAIEQPATIGMGILKELLLRQYV